jgi:hypothetical protein
VAGKVSVPEKVGLDNVILESVPEKLGEANVTPVSVLAVVPKEIDVDPMVIALLANIAFVTELVGKDSVPPAERVNVPVKVGFALGAYVEDAVVVVRYP